MPADSKGVFYKNYIDDWNMIRVVLAGERAMKTAAGLYLPKLSGQNESEYKEYLGRASFFNATHRTLQGLTGAIIRRAPVIEVPGLLEDRLDNITLTGESIWEIVRKSLEAVMGYGYYGLLVDLPPGEQTAPVPYIVSYECTDILNFQVTNQDGKQVVTMITLAEQEFVPIPDDPFEVETKDLVRMLFLDDATGNYTQRLFEKKKTGAKEEWIQRGEDVIPVVRGVPLKEIPFVFINASTTAPQPSKPPILDLANVNIKHWQISADYYHGLHYCAMPTPWAAGFKTGSELYIGAKRAWITDDPQAKCGFLEFTGQGLGSIEKAIDKLESRMAILGAKLLEEQKKAAEAEGTLRLRSSGDVATLSTIAIAVEEGIYNALVWVARMTNADEDVSVEFNKDFVSDKISPQEITALLQTLQAGKISLDTFLYNLQEGEILPPERTIEDEKDLIESEANERDLEGIGAGLGLFGGATGATATGATATNQPFGR